MYRPIHPIEKTLITILRTEYIFLPPQIAYIFITSDFGQFLAYRPYKANIYIRRENFNFAFAKILTLHARTNKYGSTHPQAYYVCIYTITQYIQYI